MDSDLFARAKDQISVSDLVEAEGCKLVANRGWCPIDGCGRKKGERPFAVFPGKKSAEGRFKCFSCGKHGDVIELEQLLRGDDVVTAARRLVGEAGRDAPPPRPRPVDDSGPDDAEARKLRYAREMWGGAAAVLRSLAEKYLLARGIHPAVIADASPSMRYHPAARHSWDAQRGDWVRAPALLLQIETPAGPTGGVHATYLLRDGSGRDKALGKRMWGPQRLDGVTGGAWLIGPVREGYANTPLVIGEGVETVLSLVSILRLQGRRARGAAALSLDRLQGGLALDADQCIDLASPKAALLRADAFGPAPTAFTWPCPAEQPWPELLVAVDRDMGEWSVKARTGRGKPVPMKLAGEARAILCAHLVRQQWRAAGHTALRPAFPPVNSDWNDELRRQVEADLARLGVRA